MFTPFVCYASQSPPLPPIDIKWASCVSCPVNENRNNRPSFAESSGNEKRLIKSIIGLLESAFVHCPSTSSALGTPHWQHLGRKYKFGGCSAARHQGSRLPSSRIFVTGGFSWELQFAGLGDVSPASSGSLVRRLNVPSVPPGCFAAQMFGLAARMFRPRRSDVQASPFRCFGLAAIQMSRPRRSDVQVSPLRCSGLAAQMFRPRRSNVNK